MTTMVFITHCWKRARLSPCLLTLSALLSVCALLGAVTQARAQTESASAEVVQLELRRKADALELAATMRVELSATLQEALNKGVPLIFVTEVEIYRERWYWFDKSVSKAQRQLRLIYQPIARRWRLSIGQDELGAALAQSFESLEEALGVIRRVSGWRVAEYAQLERGSWYRLEMRFRLDTAQLPRPLQIGALGTSDWVLDASASRRFKPETLK